MENGLGTGREEQESTNPSGSGGGRDWVTLGILSVLGIAVIFLVVQAIRVAPEPTPDPGEHARVMITPREIPPFTLVDQRGELFDRESLEGRYSLLFFGYTSCPDVCPFVLQELARVQRTLDSKVGSALEMPNVVFVSVDPRRDSSTRLEEYVGFFDSNFTGVSGTDSQLSRLAEAVGAYYEAPGEEAGESYLVNHASKLFLIDPRARFLALLDDPHDPDEFIDLLVKVQAIGDRKP